MLLLVQGDSEYMLVRRRGRFSMEVACAQSAAHRSAAVKSAMSKFLHNMAVMGFEYVDDGRVEVVGNLPHIEFSENVTADLGPLTRPDPRDLPANEKFERAEKARQALDMEDSGALGLMDFRIIATFKKRLKTTLVPKLKLANRQ